ncbi:unnamed protein product [Rhizophagus irregularis]|nr:unnamed protein product [Rhizophagus irregularis]CAB4428594.1 unnamed protein product [Rhizophagus irregularis]
MTSNTFYNTEQLAIVTENIIQPSCGERFLKIKKERAATKVAWRVLRFILMGPMMTTATETEQLPQQNAQQKWTQRSKLINTANAIILPVYLNCGFNIT